MNGESYIPAGNKGFLNELYSCSPNVYDTIHNANELRGGFFFYVDNTIII